MIMSDASVVVELLTNGPLADSIRSDLSGRTDSFVVPHLIDVEVMSALRRLVAGQKIDSHLAITRRTRRSALVTSSSCEITPVCERSCSDHSTEALSQNRCGAEPRVYGDRFNG